MDSLEFLKAVLPSSGHYCGAVWSPSTEAQIQKTGQQGYMRQFFRESLEELATQLQTQSDIGRNVYMAMASFTAAGSRKRAAVQSMRSLYLDLDCGFNAEGKPKSFASKRVAVEDLTRFLSATGLAELGPPLLLDSGGGVHVHWPLTEDVSLDAWEPVAARLKQAALHHGFAIDASVTSDPARILRPPGTRNFKYDPARMCVVREQGGVFTLEDVAQTLSGVVYGPTAAKRAAQLPAPTLSLPGIPLTSSSPSNVARALMANTNTSFKGIMVRTQAGTGCAQVAHYVAHAADDGMEPLWRGLLSLAKYCDDGVKAAAKISALHPYDIGRTQSKLAEIKGPYSCVSMDSINPGVCTGCQHWGQITNPLALGRELALVTTPTPIHVETAQGPAQRVRPTPPYGFSYGANGGVFTRVVTKGKGADAEDDVRDVMLLPFDFYMVDTLLEDQTYSSRFVAIRDHLETIVTIPNKVVTSREQTAATLAGQNIMAAHGAGSDAYLVHYVRSSIAEASAAGKYLVVPPNFGWQKDHTFALGDTMYNPDNTFYTYVSSRLSNLIEVTEPKGDLAEWTSVVQMLMRKGMWGQIAIMGCGFGSAMMEFAPAGSQALTMHVCSIESGTGKTLAVSLANSVWGHPTNYFVKPSTSDRTMMQRAGMWGSLPLSIDEVTNKIRAGKQEWFPNQIFDYAQGGHKLKGLGAANAEMRDDLHWKGWSILTSNNPMMENMLAARDTTSQGEAMRMMEWNTGPTKLVWTLEERVVVNRLADNYGVAGRVFAQWLVTHRDLAQQVYQSAVEQWQGRLHPEDNERFWTSGAAAVLAALTLLGPKYANIIEIPLAPIFDFFKLRVQEGRRAINTNRQFASDLLNAFIRENHGSFVKMATTSQALAIFSDGREVRPDSTRRDVKGRVEVDVTPGWTDFYIDIDVMKRFCATRNRSYSEFVKELQRTSVVTEQRKNLLANTKGPEMRARCLKISTPNLEDDTTK